MYINFIPSKTYMTVAPTSATWLIEPEISKKWLIFEQKPRIYNRSPFKHLGFCTQEPVTYTIEDGVIDFKSCDLLP